MDITLQIIAKQKNHLTRNSASRYSVGDILNIFEKSKITEPPTNSNFVFVHILGVPITNLDKIKKLLDPITEQIIIPPNEIDYKVIARRKWKVDVSALPLNIKRAIQTNREVTINWSDVKNFIKDKVTNNFITIV